MTLGWAGGWALDPVGSTPVVVWCIIDDLDFVIVVVFFVVGPAGVGREHPDIRWAADPFMPLRGLGRRPLTPAGFCGAIPAAHAGHS